MRYLSIAAFAAVCLAGSASQTQANQDAPQCEAMIRLKTGEFAACIAEGAPIPGGYYQVMSWEDNGSRIKPRSEPLTYLKCQLRVLSVDRPEYDEIWCVKVL